MKNKKNARLIVPVLLLSLLIVPFMIKSGKQSLAVTTATEVRQLDAGYAELNGSGTYYATIGWKGPADYYGVYQVMSDKTDGKCLGVVTPSVEETPGATASPSVSAAATATPAAGGLKNFMVTLTDLIPGSKYTYRIYESDSAGNRATPSDTGVLVENIKTIPVKLGKPSILGVYQNLNESEFSFKTDGYSDGYQFRAETLGGKKLRVVNVTDDRTKLSLKPNYPGKIACFKVRGYVDIGNGEKRYGEWSDTVEYGYAKKLKLTGKKDTIKISGIKVEGATKKEIYVSLKKNKGYKLAKKIGAKTTSCKISKFGKKYVQSKKKYYVRIYYYYKVGKVTRKSPVYDQDIVLVKPAYSYIRVE